MVRYFFHSCNFWNLRSVYVTIAENNLQDADYNFGLSNEMQNKNVPNISYPFYIHWWQKLNQRENCLCRFCVFEYKNVRG